MLPFVDIQVNIFHVNTVFRMMTSDRHRENFMTCLRKQELTGSDSLNRKLLRDRMLTQKNFFHSDLKGHFGCVNAIEFTWGRGEYIASGGDDRRVILWNVERALSQHGIEAVMMGQHNSNIFCLGFDIYNKKIFSGGNDEKVIIHDIHTGKVIDMYLHEDVIYGLSTDPNNDHVFASACDDGSAFIFDTRLPTAEADAFTLAKYDSPMHSIVYNTVEPRLLATANAKEGIGLWDVRKPKVPVMRYGSNVQQSCMSVRISQSGERIIAIRRRLPLVLYDIKQRLPLCEFDHESYYNSCTMKSCSFAGVDDEYVLSGSDDFNLYMWHIPDDLSSRSFINSAHAVLRGHRSIVNQVRSNPDNNLIISSGVEKVIKAWSPYDMTCSVGNEEERPLYTHEEYINLILNSGQGMSHDYSQQSVDEEPRMMAFFDSLVQREIEGWSSDELSSNDEELYRRIVQVTQSDSESTLSTETDGERLSPFSRSFVTVMASRSVANTPEGRLLDPNSEFSIDYADIANSAVTSTTMAVNHNESDSLLDGEATDTSASGNVTEVRNSRLVCKDADAQITEVGTSDSSLVNGETDSCVVNGETDSYVVKGESDSYLVKGETDSCVVNGETDSYVVKGETDSCMVNGETSLDSGHSTKTESNSSVDLSLDTSEAMDLSRHPVNNDDVVDYHAVSPSDDAIIDMSLPSSSVSAAERTTRNNDSSGTRRVYVDMSGSQISVQMLPRTRPSPENRRRISQLIAWRRRNYNKQKKRPARISSSDDSDDETSVSAVRAKVLGQTAANRRGKSGYEMRKNLRSLVVYSSSDSDVDNSSHIVNTTASHNNGMLRRVDSLQVTAADAMMTASGPPGSDSCDNVNNNCDVLVDISAIQKCDHDLCTSNSTESEKCTNNNTVTTELIADLSTTNDKYGKLLDKSQPARSVLNNRKPIRHNRCGIEPLEPCTSAAAISCDRNDRASNPTDPLDSYTTNRDSGYGTVNLSLPEVDNGNSQPMWAEFKRFKSRMKKAQRYYRQHAKKQSQRHSSDDDDDDDDDD